MGLEGLPTNSYEVYGFDLARDAQRGGDRVGLVLGWVLTVPLAALAVTERAPILLTAAAVAIALMGWWSAVRLRSSVSARRMMRRRREP
jgi:hypothetical protein